MPEYLHPDIANEGVAADEGYQPFVDRPHIPDYAFVNKTNHPLRKYFPEYSGIPYKPHLHPFPA